MIVSKILACGGETHSMGRDAASFIKTKRKKKERERHDAVFFCDLPVRFKLLVVLTFLKYINFTTHIDMIYI